jgi:LPXTG-site transpeptidase (sortase) family protein
MRPLRIGALALITLGVAGLALEGVWPTGSARLGGWLVSPLPVRSRPVPAAVLPAPPPHLEGHPVVPELDGATVLPLPDEAPAAGVPEAAGAAPAAPTEALPAAPAPITRLRVGRIGLDTDVVPAPIIDVPGGTTWAVPAFAAGHGEGSAGAGEHGNAVLLGHVASPDAGSVFRHLHRVQAGDVVDVFSHRRRFTYVVVEVRIVPRTDVAVLAPTGSATLSLITCTGTWLPALQEFSHRLVVRAELASAPETQ